MHSLNEKRRNAPASSGLENPAGDEAAFPQYDPSDEAGFDGAADFSASAAEPAEQGPGIRFANALESVPELVRTCLRERFQAEFSTLRFAKKVFSFREDASTDSTDDSAEESSEESDET